MSVRLVHGDCLEVMKQIPNGSIDAIVTDPPFTAAGGSTNGRTSAVDGQFFRYWLSAVLSEVRRIVRPTGCGFICCDWRTVGDVAAAMSPPGERQAAEAWSVSQALVWDREGIGLGSPFRNSYEMITFARGPKWQSTLAKDIPTVIRYRWPYGRHEFHGAEKPVGLMGQLVEWAAPRGATVIDPFCGSGTTGIACVQTGRNFIGIEMDEGYLNIARRRIEEAQMQPALPLFVETAP